MAYELDIDSIFSYHPPKSDEVADAHDQVREGVRLLAREWNSLLPPSAEKTLAIRHLQEAMMFANSAIAQHGS